MSPVKSGKRKQFCPGFGVSDMLNWLLVLYMWLTVHRPYEIWTAFAAYRPVLICAICFVIVWLCGTKEKRVLGNIFTPAILFYMSAITLSTYFSPLTNIFINHELYVWCTYIVFFLVLMTSVKTERDLKIIVTGFSIVAFLFIAHSYIGYLQGVTTIYGGTRRLRGINHTIGDVNDYGAFIICSLPLLLPLLVLCKKYWHYLFVLGYVLLTLRSVMLTGSRTAFVMVGMLMVLPILFSRHRFKLLPLLLIAMPVSWWIMPESMQNRYRTIWDDSISQGATYTRNLRVSQFYAGIENWTNYPIFGSGPATHGRVSGGHYRAHNLAGEVASELGTVGIIAFLTMLLCFGINHYNIWKNYKYLQEKDLGKEGLYCWWLSMGVMYAIAMVLLQGLGLPTAYRFTWVWFGAFQALAAMIMQEKVNDALQGKLLPSLPKRW